MRAPVRLFLASSNPGKLAEYRALAQSGVPAVPSAPTIAFELLPGFESLPAFEENAPTFAENAAGKALHYSRFCEGLVFADDSGFDSALPTSFARLDSRSADGRRRSLLGAWTGKSWRRRGGIEDLAMIPFSIFPRLEKDSRKFHQNRRTSIAIEGVRSANCWRFFRAIL